MPELHTGRISFPITRWSVVLNARKKDDAAAARAAISELCQLYWYPLYSFARRDGWNPEDAEDLTQSFFGKILEENLFEQTEPAAGRLRSFLLKAFTRDLADARKAARRVKRGGGTTLLNIDLAMAESRFQNEPAAPESPALEFDRQWAVSVLAGSVDRLAGEYQSDGKHDQFQHLRPFLGVDSPPPTAYEELSTGLGLSKPALRQAVHRMRERFRAVLRAQIADTLQDPNPETIDNELETLKVALRLN